MDDEIYNKIFRKVAAHTQMSKDAYEDAFDHFRKKSGRICEKFILQYPVKEDCEPTSLQNRE